MWCKKDYDCFKSYNLDTNLLKTKGYYYCDLGKNAYRPLNDTVSQMINIIILYKNGILFSLGTYAKDFGKIEKLIYVTSISDSLHQLYNDGINWGNFQIVNDTLKVQSMYYNLLLPGIGWYSILEDYGLILNDSTIKMNMQVDRASNIITHEIKYYHFKKFPYKPDSSNWIMDNKRLNRMYEKGYIGNKKLYENSQ